MQVYEENATKGANQQPSSFILPRILSVKRTRAAWKKHVKALNAACPLVERQRTKPDGSVIVFKARKKVISNGVLATGRELVYFYITAYQKVIDDGITLQPGELPVFWTNGSRFGEQLGISGRAMRTHMAILEKTGFIKKTGHGSKHDYELFISPDFLFTEAQLAEFEAAKTATKSLVSPDERNKLPHNVSLETLETKEKEITQVDKSGVALQQRVLANAEDDCHTLGTQETCNKGLQRGEKPPKTAPQRSVDAKSATRQDTKAGGAAPAADTSRLAVFKAYVENFWHAACVLLYPGADFNDHMHRQAKNAIWIGVYEGFRADLTDSEWQLYHAQAIERLKLAANYYENHPDKWAPMPYHEFVPGTGYFDRENKRGFTATHDWLTKQQVWKRQQAVNAALSRAQREINLQKSGKSEKLAKRLRHKTPLQLFKFHEEKIKRLGRPALDKFYAMHAINR